MAAFVPFFLNALIGALASKILLFCIKREGGFFGLFISWLFVSLLALCTPYQFLCALLFGFLFVKVTSVENIVPYGILAVLLFWFLHPWLNDVVPEFLRSAQNDLQQRWHYVKTVSIVSRQGGLH